VALRSDDRRAPNGRRLAPDDGDERRVETRDGDDVINRERRPET
jgi:hypothetical protein